VRPSIEWFPWGNACPYLCWVSQSILSTSMAVINSSHLPVMATSIISIVGGCCSHGRGYLEVTGDLSVTHSAEGSIMPYLMNRLIFSLTPGRVPFLIRPVANMIFSSLDDLLVKPNIQANIDYVSRLSASDLCEHSCPFDRSTACWRSRLHRGSPGDKIQRRPTL
jgi:hypothetical protein